MSSQPNAFAVCERARLLCSRTQPAFEFPDRHSKGKVIGDIAGVQVLETSGQRGEVPFEPFERYSPYGTPAEVAEFLHPYVEAGASAFNIIPCTDDHEAAVSGVAEVRRLLTT